jgi:hypothetical protein
MFKIAHSAYDGTCGLCIALQTYSKPPPVLGSVQHSPCKCFVSFYDVGVVAFFWVQGSVNVTKNCFVSKAK